jgi:hypothetical protein
MQYMYGYYKEEESIRGGFTLNHNPGIIQRRLGKSMRSGAWLGLSPSFALNGCFVES